MLLLLGVLAACILMAVGNSVSNNTLYLIAGVFFVAFGSVYFKR